MTIDKRVCTYNRRVQRPCCWLSQSPASYIYIYIFKYQTDAEFQRREENKKRESLSLSLTGESELLEGDWKMVALSIR
jgi:hypothetical protein